MGTFLGNLQVLGASEAEVAAALPKATVDRWSERFVTVLDEHLGYVSAGQSAKKLSRQLPRAVVLGVGLVDSDAVELSVWQAGKRITAQLDGYEGALDKRGDPKKFCAALGLPEEDIPRLKGVWAKGNAEDKLWLTAALLGAPLYCRVDQPPEKRAVRDAELVDRWLARRPDPPKVKNQTKAELIQELEDVQPEFHLWGMGVSVPFVLHHVDPEGWYSRNEDEWCRIGPDGTVIPASPEIDPRPEADGTPVYDGPLSVKWGNSYQNIGRSRILNLANWYENSGFGARGSQVVGDSAGLLPLPFPFRLDGDWREFDHIWGLEDGGILVWYRQLNLADFHGPRSPYDLVRYAADGSVLWRRRFGKADDSESYSAQVFWDGLLWLEGPQGFFSVDLDGKDHSRLAASPRSKSGGVITEHTIFRQQDTPGEVWLEKSVRWWEPAFQSADSVVRFSRDGQLLREDPLPEGMNGIVLGAWQDDNLLFLPDRMVVRDYRGGLWLLNRQDMTARAHIFDGRSYGFSARDGAGRIWVWIGNSTLEAYDPDLNLLSRHRLKGCITLGPSLDSEGRLCVRTCDERRHILRTYRLSG